MRRLWSDKEDRALLEMAGHVPARVIATHLGRPKAGVHNRLRYLKDIGRFSGTAVLYGERHWNAKLTDVQAAMIGALYDAGFTTTQIREAWKRPLQVDKRTIDDICACRVRRGRTDQ